MAAALTTDELKKVNEFQQRLSKSQLIENDGGSPSEKQVIKFLMARKFDVDRSITLYKSHQEMRKREGLMLIDVTEPNIYKELISEKFTVLPELDYTGATIALFTARLHEPEVTCHSDTLKALIVQLDIALESTDSQRNGLLFIYDMSASKFNNFDYELSIKILNMLKGSYPARLKKVLIVTAPLWFKAPFNVLRLFVREKLRDRVFTVKRQQLIEHIPASSLPRHLGGTVVVNHKAWLEHCLKELGVPTTDHLQTLQRPGGLNTLLSSRCDSQSTPVTPMTEDPLKFQRNDTDESEVFHTLPGTKRTNRLTSERNNSEPDLTQLPTKKRTTPFYEDSIQTADPHGHTVTELMTAMRTVWRKKGLIRKYEEIKGQKPTGTFEASRVRDNMAKNRYTDVPSVDQTRVKLQLVVNEPHSDYINANYVDSYKHKAAYISTQGPLPNTFNDFWRMIWEQQVLIIVMVTKCVERGRLKCGQYWPEEAGTDDEYGQFLVKNAATENTSDYNRTELHVTDTKSGVTRRLTHLQFQSWPDYGVPQSAEAFLHFLDLVRHERGRRAQELGSEWSGHPSGPPIVIHCSAGIGRSGTFIAVDILTSQLSATGRVNIQQTVQRIRQQRAFSIQMPDQYVFLHTALLEYAHRENWIETIDLDGFDRDSDDE